MLSSSDYKHANQIYKNNNGNILWLGDFSSADDIEWIRQKNIRTVVTAAHGLNIKYDSSVRHYVYTLQDKKTQNMIQYFDQVSSKIQKGLKFGSVLVHCGAGVSRSATFVIAYLMKYQKKTFHQALKYTRQKRPVICPNLGFQLQLKKYIPKSTLQIYAPDVTQGFPKSDNKLFSSLYTTNKTSKIQSFPQILKPRNFEFTNLNKKSQPKGWRQGKIGQKKFMTKSLVSKNLQSESNNYKKSEIKKIAQFRFGTTNTTKWGFY